MPIRFLIADDHEISRTRLAELLNGHAGWEVCAVVENGQEAVAKAIELRPDIIVLDLAMPVMDGLRATREIGRALTTVPIVIYSFHGGKWLEAEAKKAGARNVVAKPNVGLLLSTIEALLSKEPGDAMQSAMPASGSADADASKPAEEIRASSAEPSVLENAEAGRAIDDGAIGEGAIGDPSTPLE